ncbi:uncharacterized protein LOC106165323 [Lingula anatina]|uniref:Uncharacterized protein LOC106165323 n=1 Tax=Lingula anatina TaxID=7574 RepID=A0A1S3IL86_LINAN|nr:uncharacterized protein LOC106165323 [Lingula anatina]|eukprot:XP_013398982.1 uncharacterized protein LOC106165323 [Lingula anatina]
MLEPDFGSLMEGEPGLMPHGTWNLVPSPSRFLHGISHVGNSVSSWLESGRQLTSRAQELVAPGILASEPMQNTLGVPYFPSAGNELARPDEGGLHNVPHPGVLENIATAFQRQEVINRVHSQLGTVNYLVNVANYMKHKHVEQAVVEGHRQLHRLCDNVQRQAVVIDDLNNSVQSLSVEVDLQRQVSDRLSTSLDAQQALLDASILENREAIEKQNSVLAKQQEMVNNLLQQRLRHDFYVDSVLVGFCAYVCNTFLVKFPLKIALTVIPVNRRTKKWLDGFTRLMLVLSLIKILKTWSIKCGLHNSVGGLTPYMRKALQLLVSSLQNHREGLVARFKRKTNSPNKRPATSTTLDLC